MQAVLIVVHLIVAVAMIFVVLLQRSEGGALGMGGGGSGLGGLFTARGAANTLTRTTVILGVLFFVTSMALTMLTFGGRQPASILGTPAPAPSAPGAPPTLPSLPAKGANPAPATAPAAGGAPARAPATGPAPPTLPSLPRTQ